MSLAQERARHALGKIKHLQSTNDFGNYVSFIKALPANILRSGLGQAMAMERMGAARGGATGRGHQLLCEHMEEWLLGVRGGDLFHAALAANPRPRGLMEAIIHPQTTQDDYARCQAEALGYLEWLKKFAVAFLSPPIPANKNGNPERSGDAT